MSVKGNCMTQFDDILKKAQKSVTTANSDPRKQWEGHIGSVLFFLDKINEMYSSKLTHHIQSIERVTCKNCKAASYMLVLYDVDHPLTLSKYYVFGWKSAGFGEYLCSNCNKP